MIRPVARKSLHVDATNGDGPALEMLKALGSEPRIAILSYLGDRVVPVNQIAADLGLPPSTATMHIVVLEKAGLLHTEMRPASRGLQKVCARTYDELVIDLPRGEHHTREAFETTMPIGGYSDFSVEPTCGLARSDGLIGYLDDSNSFYEPDHVRAQPALVPRRIRRVPVPQSHPTGSQRALTPGDRRSLQRSTPARSGLA